MNEGFFDLSNEKQLRIVNAGFEVFAGSDYKRASTEQIAQKAEISKALLFYYFHNKKTLYLFLFDCARKMLENAVLDGKFEEKTDFFEMCAYAAMRKFELIEKTPHLMDFLTRSFYEQNNEASQDLGRTLRGVVAQMYATYFKNVDYSKFKEGVNPADVLQMLSWMGEGYCGERRKMGQMVDPASLKEKYEIWAELLKRATYKEEFL